MIDLHTHSTASDGSMSPAELVRHGVESGLSAIALTDHDTVSGLAEALEAAKGDIEVVPGVEFSAVPPNPKSTVHILGLYIDHQDPDLRNGVERVLRMRNDRNPRILDRLEELGLPVSMEEVRAESGGETIGRVHMANVMVKKGFVQHRDEAFSRFIGTGGHAIVPKERLTPEEAISLIRGAGGVPVLAHPNSISLKNAAMRDYIGELTEIGLLGMEVFYSGYPQTLIDKFNRLARQFGLVRSGGSDFHGTNKKQIRLGVGKGNLYVHDELLPPIRALSR